MAEKYLAAQALPWKFPAGGFSMRDDEIVSWADSLGPRPTQAEIEQYCAEYKIWKAAQDQAEADRIAAKAQAIVDNLPSWAQIDQAITDATTIAALKAIVKKGFRACYVHIKDSTE